MVSSERYGNLYIISAPSGAGKSTLLSRLVMEDTLISYSVSHTTRKPRDGERHGIEYYFAEHADFEKLIGEEAFLEWAEVHGNYYGTSREPVLEKLEQGKDVVVDIDVAGAAIIRKKLPTAINIFILPPDYLTLRARLEERGKDAADVIERRLDNAAGEIRRVEEYDYVIVNDTLETCYRQLRSIIDATRCRTRINRQTISKVLATFEARG